MIFCDFLTIECLKSGFSVLSEKTGWFRGIGGLDLKAMASGMMLGYMLKTEGMLSVEQLIKFRNIAICRNLKP